MPVFVRYAFLAALTACSHSQAGSSNAARVSSDVQAVLKAEREWVRVTLEGNVDAFSSFLADEYIAVVSGGRTVNKATWASALRAGTTKYESVDLSSLRVRLYHNTAVVFGEYTQKGTSGGKDNSGAGKYVNTWIRRDDGWKLVASGFSRIPTQSSQ